MGTQSNASPVIIKRKKIVSDEGHHGGAWKVAYADFVTAMMAFFMLMWLLNATTEKQRKGIADYFNPTVPVNRISGGGDGMFGGDSIFSQDTMAHNATGALHTLPADASRARGQTGVDLDGAHRDAQDASFEDVAQALLGRGGESLVSQAALKHVVTRVTDEGLIIELFDRDNATLFEPETENAQPLLADLLRMIAGVTRLVRNDIAVEGHTRARPRALVRDPGWALSQDRADRARQLLTRYGVDTQRISRVTGHSDREPTAPDPMAVRNNRLEIILLRSDL